MTSMGYVSNYFFIFNFTKFILCLSDFTRATKVANKLKHTEYNHTLKPLTTPNTVIKTKLQLKHIQYKNIH